MYGTAVPDSPRGRNQALRQAASNGDVAQVHMLLASTADPNAADAEGWTSLHWSCAHVDVTRVLLDAGAAVDAPDRHGKTTLHWAATEGRQEVAEVLIAAGSNVNARDHEMWTPLQWSHEHADVARLLLRCGADVDATDKFGKTCLHWSAQDGKDEVVRLLLQAGSAPNRADSDGMTPLHWACKHLTNVGQEAASILAAICMADNRSDYSTHHNLQIQPGPQCAIGGHTGCGGHEEAVRLLLHSGASASIEAQDSQSLTPLSWAAYNGYTGIIQQLIQQRQQDYQQRQQHQQHGMNRAAAVAAGSADACTSLGEDAITTAAKVAASQGHMQAFALLILELGQQYPAALHMFVRGPHFPPTGDAVLAIVGRSLADRQVLEQQRQQLAQERAAVQRERDELGLLRMGVQQLIVQGAGVIRSAMQLDADGAQSNSG